MSPEITVILCTFDRAPSLQAALGSLVALRTNNNFCFEILVIDDGSTDHTREVVCSFETESPVEVRYIFQENAGVAAARNCGVRFARGAWVAFFDDDQLADRDWLLCLMQTAQAVGADCVGGPYRLALPPGETFALTRYLRSLLGENPLMQSSRPRHRLRVDPRISATPGTGNVIVRRKLFEDVGLFADGLRYGEDLEFFTRARRSGAKFAIAPNAIVYHVIPHKRLSPSYLLAVAAKNGQSGGEIDARVAGMQRALWVAAMRSIHLFCWTLPMLIFLLPAGDRGRLLSRKCAARYATEYIRSVINAAWQQLPVRTAR